MEIASDPDTGYASLTGMVRRTRVTCATLKAEYQNRIADELAGDIQSHADFPFAIVHFMKEYLRYPAASELMHCFELHAKHKFTKWRRQYLDIHNFLSQRQWRAKQQEDETGGTTWLEIFAIFDFFWVPKSSPKSTPETWRIR